VNPFANNLGIVRDSYRHDATDVINRVALTHPWGAELAKNLIHAIDHIEALDAELRRKDDELQTLRFIGQQPETLTGKPPGTLDIVPGPPTLKQRIKAAIAAFKRHS